MNLHAVLLPKRPPSLFSLLLVVFLLAFVCGDAVSGAVLGGRQDTVGESRGTATTAVSTRAGSTATRTGDSPSMTTAPTGGKVRSGTATASTRESVPTLLNNGGPQELDPQTVPVYNGVGLPIMPSVTPGIAVAGVLLMLAGLPYCLIGIKNKKLQIFLSVAYLCSLGVTVLIVYVMNPPVKDAIQGAYVLAATVTGLFFGAVAVIFPEVTEKLGCLLGGFCLSMWFLVLKPGGLITNTYGKLIIIAVFCFVVFALAFHRITKPYALISACSFSGATSIVLGVDCFSRAGLKEFWLYIWNLNESMFPLDTNTYPHTRGMRVEIAIILIITAVGIMSQMKLWKIIKERRDQKRANKQKEQEDVEKLDEDVGKRVEEEDRRARVEWEKVYGNTDGPEKETRPDSGVAGSRTDSRITLTDNDEITEVGGFGVKKVEGKSVDETTVNAGELTKDPEQNIALRSQEQRVSTLPAVEEVAETKIEQTEEEPEHRLATEVSITEAITSAESLAPTAPPMLIRQHIPYLPDEDEIQEDDMSLATYADTITHIVHLQGIAKIEDSYVITVEIPGVSEDEAITKTLQTTGQIPESGDAAPLADQLGTLNMEKSCSIEAVQTATGLEEEIMASDEPKVSSISGEQRISQVVSVEKTGTSPASLSDLDMLQNHCSRIHKTYRTNEWAKHLADADAVELDDLSPYVEEGLPEEAPVPVVVAQLEETAALSKPQPSKLRRASQERALRDITPLSFAVTATIPHSVPVPAPLPSPAVTPPPSVTPGTPPKPILRSSSIPMIPEGGIATIDKSAAQHTVLQPPPPPSRAISPAPAIPYENTLIGRRESMLKMRPSLLIQEQMLRAASPSGYQSTPKMGDTTPNSNRLTPINMDDMTLSQRRELLLNQQLQQTGPQSPSRSQTPMLPQSRTQTPMPPLSPRNSFGINPPSPTLKQNHLLQTWRESLKQDAQLCQQAQTQWGERKALDALNEKQQAAIFKKEKAAERVQRNALVEERMRQPDMLNAHREAMRRLQAGASTK